MILCFNCFWFHFYLCFGCFMIEFSTKQQLLLAICWLQCNKIKLKEITLYINCVDFPVRHKATVSQHQVQLLWFWQEVGFCGVVLLAPHPISFELQVVVLLEGPNHPAINPQLRGEETHSCNIQGYMCESECNGLNRKFELHTQILFSTLIPTMLSKMMRGFQQIKFLLLYLHLCNQIF